MSCLFDQTGRSRKPPAGFAGTSAATGYSREEVSGAAPRALRRRPTAAPHVHATDRAIIGAALVRSMQLTAAWREPAADDTLTPNLPFRSGHIVLGLVVCDELTVKGAPEVIARRLPRRDSNLENTVSSLAA